jgi:hypothetical protein
VRCLYAFVSLFLVLACGKPADSEEEPAVASVQTDSVTAVDSIGVMMGDNNYVLGAIADFTTLPGGCPAILDRVKGTVSVFDSTGTFLYSFGGFGEGPGEFQYPFCMTRLSSGILIVAEMMGYVTALDADGQYLAKWQVEGMGGLPLECIPFDDSTFVCYYFAMKLDETGFAVNYSLKRYHALTGEVITDYFDWSGEPNPATDFTPAYIVAAGDGNGLLFVSMVNNPVWMVEVYGESPEPLDSILAFTGRERLAVPDSSMVPGVLSVRYAFSDGENETQMEMVNIPEEHPFISGLGVDGEGNIWCRRGGLPGDIWDVVSPEGEALREVMVTLPDSAYFIDMDVSPHGILAFDMFTEDYHRLYIME